MTFNYYLRTANKSSKSESLVYLYLREKHRTLKISTLFKVAPKYWDNKKQRVKPNYQAGAVRNYMAVNNFLDEFRRNIEAMVYDYKSKNPFASFDEIKIYIKQTINKQSENIFNVFEEYLKVQKAEKIAPATLSRKRLLITEVGDLLHKMNRPPIFDSINAQFIDELIIYYIDKGLYDTTYSKRIKTLSSFLNFAVQRNYILRNPIESYKKSTNNKHSEKDVLSKEDLKRLEAGDVPEELTFHRDYFLFLIYTGQRYADGFKVSKETASNNVWSFTQSKVSKKISIPLTSKAIDILTKYNFSFPEMHNSQFNRELKRLFKHLGFDEPTVLKKVVSGNLIEKKAPRYEMITSHSARYTFVSLLGNHGVEDVVVRSISGHSDIQMQGKYYKKDFGKIKEQLDSVFE